VSDTACRKKSENIAVLGVVTLYWFHVSFNFGEPGGPSLPPAFMTDCHWTSGVHCWLYRAIMGKGGECKREERELIPTTSRPASFVTVVAPVNACVNIAPHRCFSSFFSLFGLNVLHAHTAHNHVGMFCMFLPGLSTVYILFTQLCSAVAIVVLTIVLFWLWLVSLWTVVCKDEWITEV